MYINDLDNAYLYENERRKDERRAAAGDELLRGLDRKKKFAVPLPMAVIGILRGI